MNKPLFDLSRATGFPAATLTDFAKRGLLSREALEQSDNHNDVFEFLRKIGDLNYGG